MTSSLNILISGAGIAGLTAAHFLAKAGHKCTIVERAPSLRDGGQNVDIRGHGLTVLKRMGSAVENEVFSKTTKEEGLCFVDIHNNVKAAFPVDDGQGFTAEVEIMRGDLAVILYEAVKSVSEVEFVFSTTITSVKNSGENVVVDLSGHEGSRTFDLVIAADGWASKTRHLAFGESASDCVKDLDQWSCWYTVPHHPTDDKWARWCNSTKGRMMLVRPDNEKVTRVSLWTMTRDKDLKTKLNEALKWSTNDQKRCWEDCFAEAGWEAPRLLEGLKDATDFYMQKIAQVKLDTWSSGRVVLLGDAAYCPSPISGMGTTSAMVGAHVLAGEIISNPTDVAAACKKYETELRPFIDVAQQLAPGAPSMANPDTAWGIWFLHLFLGFVSWSGIYKHFGASFNPPASAMELPDYGF